MTKYEAESMFRSNYMPGIRNQENGRADHALRSCTWNDFTDFLCKDGQITDSQYANWYPPEVCYSHSERRERRERKMHLVANIMES